MLTARLLVVQNLSETCSANHLQNYLEVEGDVEVEEDGIKYFAGATHIALVTLTEDLTEHCLSRMQKAVGKSPLEGKVPVLNSVAGPPKSILIENLDPTLSEDHLFYYFDSPHSGGIEEGVLDDGVEMYPQLGMAVINFVSSEVVRGVLAQDAHVLARGIRLQVEPCYEQFHKPVIQELIHRLRGIEPAGTLADIKQGSIQCKTPQRQQQGTHQSGYPSESHSPARMREKADMELGPVRSKTIQVLQVQQPPKTYPPRQAQSPKMYPPQHSQQPKTYFPPHQQHPKTYPSQQSQQPKIYLPPPPQPPKTNLSQQSQWPKMYPSQQSKPLKTYPTPHQHQPKMFPPQQSQTSQRQKSSPAADPVPSGVPASGDSDNVLPAMKPAAADGEGQGHAQGQAVGEDQSDAQGQDVGEDQSDAQGQAVGEDQTDESVSGGESLGVDCFPAADVAQGHSSHSSHSDAGDSPSSSSSFKDQEETDLLVQFKKLKIENDELKKKQQNQEMLQLEVPPFQLRLLSEFFQADHGCKVNLRQSEGLVLLHGTLEECDKARCQLLSLVQTLAECSLTVPAAIITLLRSAKGQGYLDSILQQHPKCSIEMRKTELVFASLDTSAAETFKDDLQKRILHENVKVHAKTLCNTQFLHLKNRLEEEHLVCLTLSAEGSSGITVDGFEGHVDLAVRDIEKHNHTFQPDLEIFQLPGALAKRACEAWFSSELEEVKTLVLKNDGEITREETEDFTLKFECRPEVLCLVREKLTAIKRSIRTTSVDLSSEFNSYSECALVINGLYDRGVEEFCTLFEHSLKEKELPGMISVTLPPRCPLPEFRSGPSRHPQPSAGQGQGTYHGQNQHRYKSHHDKSPSKYIRPLKADYGNATIIVKSGNITREKVDVIVNIVAEDLNMKQTAVGYAILKKYKQLGQLLMAFQGQVAASADQVQVFLTHIPPEQQEENLPSVVLHAVIRRWSPDTVNANIKQMIQKCLLLANQAGKTSVAFPPLGVGRKFKLPEELVGNSMMNSILEFLQSNPGTMQKISVVVHDTGMARRFREMMRKKLSLPTDSASAAEAGATAAETVEDDDKEDDSNTDDEEESKGFMQISAQHEDGSEGAVEGTFEVLICTKQPSDCQEVIKDCLVNCLRADFLSTAPACDTGVFRKLDSAAFEEIQASAMKNNVVLYLAEKEVEVCGEKGGVTEVVALIRQKMLEHRDRLERADSSKRKAVGLPVHTHQLPSYWQACKKKRTKVGAALRSRSEIDINLKQVTKAEFKEVADLVMVTWERDLVGAGKDARSLSHQNIKILKVERLENFELWERYSELREKHFRRLEWSQKVAFGSVASLSQRGAVKTTQNLSAKSLLSREIYHQVNEHYLFHGTKKDAVTAICRDGLDFRLANEKTMLGRGIYAAESSTKADQYTDLKTARSDGSEQLVMILMRAVLGEPYLNQEANPPKFQRPPCKSCRKARCDCAGAEQFDSIIDDAQRIFREFVLYERSLCYPEYFITYQRI